MELKDLIKSQDEMVNRFLNWSDFGIEVEKRRELKSLIAKVRKETVKYEREKILKIIEKKIENYDLRSHYGNRSSEELKQILKKLL